MIKYDPTALLRRIAPESKIKKLVSKRASLKKSALSFVKDIDFLTESSVKRLALKTIKEYKQRTKGEPKERKKLASDPKLLVQRLQNLVVTQVASEIKSKYKGEFYIWLPSDAAEPDPEHQLKYGKKYRVGVGEMPGDRYGCRCGMQILTEDSSLEL